MSDSILRLRVESQEYDNKLKRAAEGLNRYIEGCRKAGGTLVHVDDGVKEFTQELGKMGTVAGGAKGKLGEMTKAFTDLTMQFNAMSEAEKRGQFGKALSAGLDELKQRIISTKNELNDITNELNGKVSGGGLFGGGKLDGMLQVFGGNVMTKVAGMATGLVTEMGDAVKQGIELARQGEGIRIAFERLGRGDILQGLREATHGTVTDLDLMKAAVQFNDFKLPLDQLATMLAFAQQKAKDTGQSVDYLVQSIVTGLGRKSLMILDNLGLSANEIKERMKETGDMTKAVGAIIRDQMAAAGDYVETAADRAAQANVSLQNKMEELGRKFAPVEEASNQLWTSIKIGILDIVGGPLAELLNGLTEAGRLQNAINNMNGGGNGGPTRIDRMVSMLGDGKGTRSRNTYNKQLGVFDERINQQQFRIAALSGNDAITRGLKQKAETELKALQAMRAEYVSRANDVFNAKPVNINVNTKQTEQNVASLRRQLKELEAQRKKAVKSGDQEQVENLTKQISQVKTNIGYLDPRATKTGSSNKTEEQKNTDRISELVKQYQDLATAANTADDAQKAGLTERMAKIQGEIKALQDRNTELKKFADEARQVQFPIGSLPQLNEQLKTLQTEQAKALDAKQWKDYQQQIEQTQYQIDALKGKWQDGLQATFKLNIEQQGSTDINTAKPDDITVTFRADNSDVLAKLRDIEGVNIDPKTLTVTAQTQEAIAALNSIDGMTIQPKDAAVTFRADNSDVLAKLRDIEGVNIDPKTLTVTAQTQEAIAALNSIDGMTIQPKAAEVTFKADNSDVLAKLRDIEGVNIDPKTLTVTANTADAFNQVQQLLKSVDDKTVTFTVQPKMETGTSIQNYAGISAYITSLKQQLETADYGTSLYNGLSAQLADMTTLQNLVGESLKAGLGTAMFDAADATGKDFWTRAMEGGVENTDWQAIVEKINEKLKGLGIEPIKIDFKTGNIANVGKETDKAWRGAASAMSAASSALQGLEDPGAKIAGIVGQAIANIALGFAQATAASSGGGIFGWIAAIAGGLTTMVSTIAAIHSATGYAQGGIVDGRGGGFVGGTAYSGDNISNVRLDSGELVLNMAQQNNLANALEGGNNNNIENRQPYVNGELIYLGVNNYLKRTGRGEIVVSKR